MRIPLVRFAAALRSGLRRGQGDADGPATLAFGGGLVMALGLMLLAGLTLSITESIKHLTPDAAFTIQALSQGLWVLFIAGQAMMLLGAGIAILRGRALPVWLGWVAIVLGVVSASPVGWVAFLLTLIWIVVVALLLWRRASAGTPQSAPDALPTD